MKKVLMLISLLALLSFSGCSNKDYVYVDPPMYPFSTIQAPDDVKFPIRDDYVDAYKKWKSSMYLTIDNLNGQINAYIEANKK